MRLDMLPSLLSSDIASLHGNRDRFAVTVTWEVTATLKSGLPVTEVSNDSSIRNIIGIDSRSSIRYSRNSSNSVLNEILC